MNRITHLDGNPWRSRAEAADALGVSERTITRMVRRRELERVETPDGTRYRRREDSAPHAGQAVSQDSAPHARDSATGGAGHARDTTRDGARQGTGQGQGVSRDTQADALKTLAQQLEAAHADARQLALELGEARGELVALRSELERERARPSLLRLAARLIGALKRLADRRG